MLCLKTSHVTTERHFGYKLDRVQAKIVYAMLAGVMPVFQEIQVFLVIALEFPLNCCYVIRNIITKLRCQAKVLQVKN